MGLVTSVGQYPVATRIESIVRVTHMSDRRF